MKKLYNCTRDYSLLDNNKITKPILFKTLNKFKNFNI